MFFGRCFPDSNLQGWVKVMKWSTNLQKTCIFWWTYFLSRNYRRFEFGDLITFWVFLGIWTTKSDSFRIHFPKSNLERANSVCQKCQTAVKLVKLSFKIVTTFFEHWVVSVNKTSQKISISQHWCTSDTFAQRSSSNQITKSKSKTKTLKIKQVF